MRFSTLLLSARIFRALRSRLERLPGLDENCRLGHCARVLHVGANDGNERDPYSACRLEVLWVEALPVVFAQLAESLEGFAGKNVQALVTDRDGDLREVHVSDNTGRSSSIFETGDHRKLWPEVGLTGTEMLRTSTLDSVVAQAGMGGTRFDPVVRDVQGLSTWCSPVARRFSRESGM